MLSLAAVLVITFGCGLAAYAQTGRTASDDEAVPREVSLWTTVNAGGIIGYLIMLMSVVAIALIVEHFLSMRRERFIPEMLEEKLEAQLKGKDYAGARETCEADDSFLADVVGAGLGQVGAIFGFFDMQSAMQEVSEREISKLYRKLEFLSFIAAAAPMLGLLGTVTGMIRSFNQIAATRGTAKPYQLAGGISEALVTTCMGLIVAIPCMFFVSLFRGRVDGYVAEAESVVEKLMGRFRKTSS